MTHAISHTVDRRGFVAGMAAGAASLSLVAAGLATRAWADEAVEADGEASASTSAGADEAGTAGGKGSVVTFDPQPTEYPVRFALVDGDGNAYEQTFEKAPEVAVTLTDSTCEIMCRLGLASLVAGTVEPEADMPQDIAEDYAGIPQLGDKKTLSRETIVACDPDVILGRAATFTADGQTDAATYNELGISIYTQLASAQKGNPTLEGIIQDVINIATIFDVQQAAAGLVDDLQTRLAAMQQRVTEVTADSPEPQRVLIMTNFIDGTFGLFGGATGASLQFNVIETMGATMASTESASGLTYENLLEFNPDVIVYVTANRNAETDPLVLDTLYSEPIVASVPAIANQAIVMVPYAEFMDAGPRIFNAAEAILDTLYPQA